MVQLCRFLWEGSVIRRRGGPRLPPHQLLEAGSVVSLEYLPQGSVVGVVEVRVVFPVNIILVPWGALDPFVDDFP